MFNNLIESKASRQKRMGGTLASTVVHTVLITGAVMGTLHAKEEIEKPKAEKISFVRVKNDEPPPVRKEVEPPPRVEMKAQPPRGFQLLTAPTRISDVLPDIDLSRTVTNAADFTGVGVVGGFSTGIVGAQSQAVNQNQVFYDFQVDKQVSECPGNPSPRYPDMLRTADVEGEVVAQFVVDTTGRADMSEFRVIKSTHNLFTNAVKVTLPQMKFYAAQASGQRVRQLVQMPFQFTLGKR